jgi:eukaryotic-like serine/threonine-protein kinase
MELAIDSDDSLTPYGELSELDAAYVRKQVGCNVGSLHRVVRHLASGGMGHVFLVEHIQLGAYAAAKLPKAGSETSGLMIEREAMLLSRLHHPHIVSVLDVGRLDSGAPYMLMEYVSGLELDAWLESCTSMAPQRALRILKQLASAVDYMHAHDIVHCDIKPANILFDPRADDFVKLVDFGIACRTPSALGSRGLVGTPAYMAPEQARGEACGAPVDLYGVAALALELLTGLPPYDCETPQQALTALLTRAPGMPSERGLSVKGLDAVFARGLHSDPSARYESATAFVEALEEVFAVAARVETARNAKLTLAAERQVARMDKSHARDATLRTRGWMAHSLLPNKHARLRGLLACGLAVLAALFPRW